MKTKISPTEAIASTKRIQSYIEESVLNTWPIHTGELEFFKFDSYTSAADVEAEYEKRGLVAAPFSMCEQDGKEMNEKQYVATQWKDADGKFCYLAFLRWDGERKVHCDRDGSEWDVPWWFAGVRKSALRTSDSSPSPASSDLSALEKRVAKLEAWKKSMSEI